MPREYLTDREQTNLEVLESFIIPLLSRDSIALRMHAEDIAKAFVSGYLKVSSVGVVRKRSAEFAKAKRELETYGLQCMRQFEISGAKFKSIIQDFRDDHVAEKGPSVRGERRTEEGRVWQELSKKVQKLFEITIISDIVITVFEVGDHSKSAPISSTKISLADDTDHIVRKLRHSSNVKGSAKRAEELTIHLGAFMGGEPSQGFPLNRMERATGGFYKFCISFCKALADVLKQKVSLKLERGNIAVEPSRVESQGIFLVTVRQDWPQQPANPVVSTKTKVEETERNSGGESSAELKFPSNSDSRGEQNLSFRTSMDHNSAGSYHGHKSDCAGSRTAASMTVLTGTESDRSASHSFRSVEGSFVHSNRSEDLEDVMGTEQRSKEVNQMGHDMSNGIPKPNPPGMNEKQAAASGLEGTKTQESVQEKISSEAGQNSELQSADVVEEIQVTKNVYLLGEASGGKSTLANALTNSRKFRVAHAGPGTEDISFELMKNDQAGEEIRIWDTPGMNSEESDDELLRKLQQKVEENKTVSAVVVVSKDGGRMPRTLIEALASYQKLFGESFMCGLCVCIGLNAEQTRTQKLEAKREFWTKNIRKKLSYRLPKERIFFFNGEEGNPPQRQLRKLKEWILDSNLYMVGVGKAVAEALRDIELGNITQDTKNRLKAASYAARKSFVSLVEGHKVEKKTCTSNKGNLKHFDVFLGAENERNDSETVHMTVFASGKEAEALLKNTIKSLTGPIAVLNKDQRKKTLRTFCLDLTVSRLYLVEMTAVEEQNNNGAQRMHLVVVDTKSRMSTKLSKYVERVLM